MPLPCRASPCGTPCEAAGWPPFSWSPRPSSSFSLSSSCRGRARRGRSPSGSTSSRRSGRSAEARRFTWKRPRGAAKFYVELFDQDGTLLWSQSTADTTLPLPDRLGLSTNRVYRWRVTYTFADGVSLPTNDESFMLAPGPAGRP